MTDTPATALASDADAGIVDGDEDSGQLDRRIDPDAPAVSPLDAPRHAR